MTPLYHGTGRCSLTATTGGQKISERPTQSKHSGHNDKDWRGSDSAEYAARRQTRLGEHHQTGMLCLNAHLVCAFFDAEGVSIRGYPITFDSWYGSNDLIKILSEFEFEFIRIPCKSHYVMRIDKTCAKLSVHKKSIELCSPQWGCDKPVYRVNGESRTFGALVLLFSNLKLS